MHLGLSFISSQKTAQSELFKPRDGILGQARENLTRLFPNVTSGKTQIGDTIDTSRLVRGIEAQDVSPYGCMDF